MSSSKLMTSVALVTVAISTCENCICIPVCINKSKENILKDCRIVLNDIQNAIEMTRPHTLIMVGIDTLNLCILLEKKVGISGKFYYTVRDDVEKDRRILQKYLDG